MGKPNVINLICLSMILIVTVMPMVHALDKSPKSVVHWFKKLNPHAKQKTTKLHFYFHDIATGQNATAPTIAQANVTSKSPVVFGLLRMIDDPLTVGPEMTSKRIGSAQGIYGSAAMDQISFFMNINFVFTDGIYNGSTLSLLGQNPIMHEYREMSIVGGSGVFRLARGIATAKSFFVNSTVGIVEYNVIVLHY